MISFCIISNTILLFQDNRYQTLYQDVTSAKFVATVISDETRKEYKSVYVIKIESINQNKKYANTKLRLQIKEEGILEYGDQIILKGDYIKPQKARNENGFDYAEYLKTIGIYGTVETNKTSLEIKKKYHVNRILLLANRVKHKIMEQTDSLLSNENAKLLQGILLGETEDIEEETIENFQNSSLYHMLAVSGAHISYVMITCHWLFRRLGMRKEKAITIVVLLFFMCITEFSLSVVRACIMGILLLGADMLYRKSNFINNISVALFLVLLQNPYAIKSLGVLLSFGGTIGIVLFSQNMKRVSKKEGILIKESKVKKYMKENLAVTTSAQLMIAPIIWIHFHTISITFLLSNGLASILIGPIILLGFLSIFLSFLSVTLAKIFAIFLNLLLFLLQQIARLVASFPLSSISVISVPFIFTLFYYFSLIMLHSYRTICQKKNRRKIEEKFLRSIKKIHGKKIVSGMLILLIMFLFIQMSTKKFTIYFIDVGQGDSCLILTKQNKKILIDGGGNEFSSLDVGEKILIPYLLSRGVRTLDYVMISHFDTDHCGGILSVLENLQVKTVIISKQEQESENYQKFKEITRKKKWKVKIVKAGDRIQLDQDTYLDILWPKEKQVTENVLNNNAIVAKLTYGNVSMLFTGDIEEIAEKEILKEYKESNRLKSTILKVAHHGSKTSSSQEILEKVQPKIALIGVGENNKFGHPNEEVLQRLKNIKCNIYRTDEMGEITIKVDKKGDIRINKRIK